MNINILNIDSTVEYFIENYNLEKLQKEIIANKDSYLNKNILELERVLYKEDYELEDYTRDIFEDLYNKFLIVKSTLREYILENGNETIF